MLINGWLRPLAVSLLLSMGPSLPGKAQPPGPPGAAAKADLRAGLYFRSTDWELFCDNTRTCRAAGYQTESADRTVSVLLTRRAGPNTLLDGRVRLGNYGDSASVFRSLPNHFPLALKIDRRTICQVDMSTSSLMAELPRAALSALLTSLMGHSRIDFTLAEPPSGIDPPVWSLSDQGAAAVLLKMDDTQGRIGTPGALIRRGRRSENAVLAPLPAPVVPVAPLPPSTASEARFLKRYRMELLTAVKAQDPDQHCDLLVPADTPIEELQLTVTRLNADTLLFSARCWVAPYNRGQGYWLVGNAPPFHPVAVTLDGSRRQAGFIYGHAKGRGLGDCADHDTWTWDGRQFVHTSSVSTGMCREVACGGAWWLPSRVADVRPNGSAGQRDPEFVPLCD